jgi:hypothetical protein
MGRGDRGPFDQPRYGFSRPVAAPQKEDGLDASYAQRPTRRRLQPRSLSRARAPTGGRFVVRQQCAGGLAAATVVWARMRDVLKRLDRSASGR